MAQEVADSIIEVAMTLRKRSARARVSAWAAVLLMSGLVAFIIYIFFASTSLTDMYKRAYAGPFVGNETLDEYRRKLEFLDRPNSAEYMKNEIEKARIDMDSKKLEGDNVRMFTILEVVTSSITRFGAVLVALYMVQILLQVMRYNFRVADHWACTADAVKLSNGQTEHIAKYMQAMSTNHIDFAKPPAVPSQTVAETVNKLLSTVDKVVPKRIRAQPGAQADGPASGGSAA